MKGITGLMSESSRGLLDSPSQTLLICFLLRTFKRLKIDCPLSSLKPKFKTKVFKPFNLYIASVICANPYPYIAFSWRCNYRYLSSGNLLKSVFRAFPPLGPMRLTPHLKLRCLSFFRFIIPLMIWSYPLYPKFLVLTPIYRL